MKGCDFIIDKRKIILTFGIIFFISMIVSAIYAVSNEITNGVISTGIVNIKIDTFQRNDDGQKVKYDDIRKKVMPGETVSLMPQVNNLGEECYVRIKVKYINDTIDFSQYVTNLSNELIKIGDYYYYDKVLKPNEEITVFDTIKIPQNVNDLVNNKEVKLEVIAQAIQERNFEPDFSSSDPWKSINPTDSISNNYNIDTDDLNSKIKIKYRDGINNDIIIPSDFFKNLKTAMPGDHFINTVEINNTNKNKVKYYLQFVTNDNLTEDISLLKKIHMTITNKVGQVLYTGPLLSNNNILLGEYLKNQTDKLEFKVSIPSELGNDYVLLNPEGTFIFSAEYKEKDIIKKVNNPKTGDNIDMAITIFLISALGLIIVILLEYRERKNIDSINNYNINPENGEKGEKDE